MGSFSWIKADYNVYNQANIVYGDKIKILVPSELGGGFIEGVYGDYGLVTDNKGQKFDILELVAIWNSFDIQRVLRQLGHYDVGKKGISDVTKTVRKYGIAISCYDSDHARIQTTLCRDFINGDFTMTQACLTTLNTWTIRNI